MLITNYDLNTSTKYYIVKISKTDGYTPKVYSPTGANKGAYTSLEVAKQTNSLICINAGLFNPKKGTYEPEGIIIENGNVIQNTQAVFYPDSMPLTINVDGDLWYAKNTIDADALIKEGISSAVCGFMPIIIDYNEVPEEQWTKVHHYTNPHQRQIIGQLGNGDYMIITCEGRGYADSVGWTIHDAQRICKMYNLKFAYNLDGGTSTELVVNGIQINSCYERDVERFSSTFIIFC